MAKTEGEWKSKTLKEFKSSESVVWRAQLSIAPDGKKFAGVRKYILKRDGTEIADRSGISFPFEADSIGDNVDAMIELLQALKGGTVRVADTAFVLKSPNGKFLKNYSKSEGHISKEITADESKAKQFSSATEAKEFRSKRSALSDWKVVKLVE